MFKKTVKKTGKKNAKAPEKITPDMIGSPEDTITAPPLSKKAKEVMDGTQLKAILAAKKKVVKLFTVPTNFDLNSKYGKGNGVKGSVMKQAIPVKAFEDKKGKKDHRLVIEAVAKKKDATGYWLPWIEAIQVGKDVMSIGTYTPPIQMDDAISWVATGPFSGCFAAHFIGKNDEVVFAHVVTVGMKQFKAASVKDQMEDISNQSKNKMDVKKKSKKKIASEEGNAGFHFVFWMRDGEGWVRQVLSVSRPNDMAPISSIAVAERIVVAKVAGKSGK